VFGEWPMLGFNGPKKRAYERIGTIVPNEETHSFPILDREDTFLFTNRTRSGGRVWIGSRRTVRCAIG
jgi:hypothetical protein